MNKTVRILAFILASLLIIASLAACTNSRSSSTPAGGPPPVGPPGAGQSGQVPGALPVQPPAGTQPNADQQKKVSGSGKIEVSRFANLYFGTAGQITDINVKEGDHVTTGTVLAKMDTGNLELALAQAKVALNQAKLNQVQANANLVTAQFNLDKVQVVSDLKDAITDDEWTIKVAEVNRKQALMTSDTDSARDLSQFIAETQLELQKHMAKLVDVLKGTEYSGAKALSYDIYGQKYDRLTVQDARIKQLAVETLQTTIDQSQDAIALAQKNIDLILRQIDQSTIVAPFNGQVAVVNQNEGDIVAAPAQSQRPILYLIDPTSLQLVIAVNELDVPKVKTNQKAALSIDAFPDTRIDGQVTAISPVPTLQGLIVNYKVTILFNVPANVEAKVGMSANATLTAE